ncbi:MAG: glycosyltransferase family 4 protein [Gammaproteobacteria bacterium]|jgi:GalNAc-alpha-(1->4)-GalNAc-alpha-(1->3)-diNAcBac-PP-undecaprenol alpha-1,4-N-acetyl-D-galactosaminyltransferase|nr:glycosyltransferase family 4 protein [Gammaproteobacteria bacterium]MBU2225640.1 glycosyltransferase family 4 protein [Gammaproteobacteria bacterium]
MKIVFLVSSLQFGGAERVATTLCNAWVKSGHQVALVATYAGTDPCFFKLEPAVEVKYLANTLHCMFGKSNLSFARLYKLRQILIEAKPDVVVSFLPSANIMAILATIGLNVPIIVSERTDPEFFPQPFIWKMLCKYLYQYADVLTVQTDSVAAKVPRLFKHIRKIKVVANPLPFTKRQFTKRPDENIKTIVSLGRLTKSKQTEQIVIAFSSLADKFPNWKLKIYGDGPCKAELFALVEQNKHKSQIEICGDTKDPWNALVNADIFMMASCFEGFPNALLEALGLAVPSIVYDCPSGPAEITENGLIAKLVPLNDQSQLKSALFEFMNKDDCRIALGCLAETSVHNRYSLEAVMMVWDEIFTSVLRMP